MTKDIVHSLLIIALSLVVGTIAGKLLHNILKNYQLNNYNNINYENITNYLQYNNEK